MRKPVNQPSFRAFKFCTKCRFEWAWQKFPNQPRSKKTGVCEDCLPKVAAKQPRKTSWESRFSAALSGARSRGLECSVDVAYMMEQLERQNRRCFYTGEELTLPASKWRTPSIDRMDSEAGYVPGNVVITLWGVNLMKMNIPLQDFFHFCQAVAAQHNSSVKLT